MRACNLGLPSHLCRCVVVLSCVIRSFHVPQCFGVGKSTSSRPSAVLSPEFLRFQRSYVIVYLIMMAADWLQGPYVYALYKFYNYGIADIGQSEPSRSQAQEGRFGGTAAMTLPPSPSARAAACFLPRSAL